LLEKSFISTDPFLACLGLGFGCVFYLTTFLSLIYLLFGEIIFVTALLRSLYFTTLISPIPVIRFIPGLFGVSDVCILVLSDYIMVLFKFVDFL